MADFGVNLLRGYAKSPYDSSKSHRFAGDEEDARDDDVEAQKVRQHIKFLLEGHFGQLSCAPYWEVAQERDTVDDQKA
jgi:hypothetical protein